MSKPAVHTQAPRQVGPLAKRERFLAYRMLLPTFLIVLSIVLLPLLANFWISFKSVELGDLREARPMFNEQLKPRPKVADQEVVLRYRVRNSSKKEALTEVIFEDSLPEGLQLLELPDNCALDSALLRCDIGTLEGGERLDIKIAAKLSYTVIDVAAQIYASQHCCTSRFGFGSGSRMEFKYRRNFWCIFIRRAVRINTYFS